VSLMRGPKDDMVVLHVEREGEKDILVFEIIRKKIELETVKESMLGSSIGYIKITSFEESTPKEFRAALETILDKGAKGLILDIRNNPGGLLKESTEIVDELIGESLIVYTKDKAGNKTSVYKSGKSKIDIPLVVLVNQYSASASEIVAGAVQDTESGIIVGTRTFGKGSVQEPILFNDGSGLKITTSKYYLPSGRSIHDVGIEPDISIDLPIGVNTFDIPEKFDTQLQKGIEIMKKEIQKLNH
ncbi:MAG TPA: S41 family peptidase, partial [Thermoanaerobacterales bacterium]|nr:S41 family peptidase [Thermoanaerobacterales bacterium]